MKPCLQPDALDRYRNGTLETLDALREIEAHLAVCPSCREAIRVHALAATPALAGRLSPEHGDTPILDDELLLRYVDGSADATDREIVEAQAQMHPEVAADIASLKAFHAEMQGFDWREVENEAVWTRFRKRFTDTPESISATTSRWFGDLLTRWSHVPLNARILIGLLLGMVTGWLLGDDARQLTPLSVFILRLLGALATPFIFVAIVHSILITRIAARMARRLAFILISNTTAAVLFGLLIVNLFQPGHRAHLSLDDPNASVKFVTDAPKSLIQPLAENNLLYVILLAVGIGVALRYVRREQREEGRDDFEVVEKLVATSFRCLNLMLRWVVALVPFAVFAVAARLVGTTAHHEEVLTHFKSLFSFVVLVLVALCLQVYYYYVRMRVDSWVRFRFLIRNTTEPLITAFSTASSSATMPVTYACLRDKVGLRSESANLGVLVGGVFNRDGTALYQAMVPLFIAQVIGVKFGLPQQITIAFLAILASICAPGLPEAGLVPMVAVFMTLNLPVEYIPLLLPLDWFLDRCRTTVNVLGEMTVTCLLDGKQPKVRPTPAPVSP